ncbi:MAG: DUF1328 domain-containing protein [Gemmatimonadales bacterium]
MLLRAALAFLVLAFLAGLAGFSGIAAASAGLVRTFFFGFVSGFVVLLLTGLATARDHRAEAGRAAGVRRKEGRKDRPGLLESHPYEHPTLTVAQTASPATGRRGLFPYCSK